MQRARAPPGACGSAAVGRRAAAVGPPLRSRRPRCASVAPPTGGAPWGCGTGSAAGACGSACALHRQAAQRQSHRPRPARVAAAAAAAAGAADDGLPPAEGASAAAGGGALAAAAAAPSVPHFVDASADEEPYSLQDTKARAERGRAFAGAARPPLPGCSGASSQRLPPCPCPIPPAPRPPRAPAPTPRRAGAR
jgi:hypothetical protein